MDKIEIKTLYESGKTIKEISAITGEKWWRCRERLMKIGTVFRCGPAKGTRHANRRTPEQIRAYHRAYKKQWRRGGPDLNPEQREKVRKAQRKYDASEAGRRAKLIYHLRTRYNMTIERYESMIEEQDGGCAICGGPPVGYRGRGEPRFHVDHDHVTGAIRGLVCMSCNHVMGACRDDASILRKAADYLERTRAD